LPVDESQLVRPTDINGINKAAGEQYHLVYNNVFGVRACSLRLTNVYGPRQLIRHNRQGFIGWFIRLALEHREIQVFGDGSQVRDFVYVDDVSELATSTPAMAVSSTSGGTSRLRTVISSRCCSRRQDQGRCASWSGPMRPGASTSDRSTRIPPGSRQRRDGRPP
jgi:UDP-glucose 4-epimerase